MRGSRTTVSDPMTDPVALTELFAALWRERGATVGTTYEVPSCPYTSQELAELHAAGSRVAFLPRGLATQDGFSALAKVFPKLDSWALLGDSVVTNDENPCGWFDYEVALDAPNTELDEEQLEAALEQDGRTLLSLNQYVVASEDHYRLEERYLDEERTWARVGARVDGRMIAVRFDGEMPTELYGEDPAPGCLLVAYDVGAGDRGPILGGRSTSRTHREVVPGEVPQRVAYPTDVLLPEPVQDLKAEWTRIANAYVALGVPEALGLTKAEYVASLPRLAPQPDEYRGRLDVPLLVEGRITWKELARLADVTRGGGRLDLDYAPINDRSVAPEEPYAVWVNGWGQRFVHAIAPDDARARLAPDEVGANLHELLAFHIAHPSVNRAGRFFEPLGSILREAFETGLSGFDDDVLRTACMCRWRGRAEIGANLHPKAFSIFRPLVRGAKVALA